MAVHFKKLGTRAASALVFVVALLTCVLLNYYTFTLFFLFVALKGLWEFYNVMIHLGYRPLRFWGICMGAFTYLAFVNTNYLLTNSWYNSTLLLPVLEVIPFLVFAGAILSKKIQPFSNSMVTLAGLVYAVVPFALLHEISFTYNESTSQLDFFPMTLLGIILLIWTNDTFAYLGGSLFGKHKMIERVSPGKTWEGTLTGILAAFGASFLIAEYLVKGQGLFWPLAGLFVPVLATIGDLVQSTMKRQANIKDTGKVMPGHGGILDRFDSLIFVIPFMVVIVKLIALRNVSG